MVCTQRKFDRKPKRPAVGVRSTSQCRSVPDYVATGSAVGGSCETKLVGGRPEEGYDLGSRCQKWQALQVCDSGAVSEADPVLVRSMRVVGNRATKRFCFLYVERQTDVVTESASRFFSKVFYCVWVAAWIITLVSLFGGCCRGGEGWRGGGSIFASSWAAVDDGALSVQAGLNGLSARSDTWERNAGRIVAGRSGWRGIFAEVSRGLNCLVTCLAVHRRACALPLRRVVDRRAGALPLTRCWNRGREPP